MSRQLVTRLFGVGLASVALGVATLVAAPAPALASPPDSMDGRVLVIGERTALFSSCWRLDHAKRTTAVLQVKRHGKWRTVAKGKRSKAIADCGRRYPYHFRFNYLTQELPPRLDSDGLGYLMLRIRIQDGRTTYTDSVWAQQTYPSRADHVAALNKAFCQLVGTC